jgi:hypothetical protein
MRRIAHAFGVSVVIMIVAGLSGMMGGCGGGGDPVVSSPSADAPLPLGTDETSQVDGPPPSVILPGAGATADDPPGTLACVGLTAAIKAGSLMTAGIVDGIVAASKTADAPLVDAADRLAAAYRAAVAASGKADEPDKIAAVGATASDMSGVCAESGLQTVG